MNGVPIWGSPLLACTAVCGPLCIVGLATCMWPWWLGTGLLCLMYYGHFVVLGSVPAFACSFTVMPCSCTLSVMLGWLAGVFCRWLHFGGSFAFMILPCLHHTRLLAFGMPQAPRPFHSSGHFWLVVSYEKCCSWSTLHVGAIILRCVAVLGAIFITVTVGVVVPVF